MNSLSEITNSGRRANKTGVNLETFVESALIANGYTQFPNHRAQMFESRKTIGGKQYQKFVPVGKTIYESERKVDFLIINKDKFPEDLIIECKWQQSSGSVDEKYPFLYFNIMKCGVPTVVLLDGNGYKKTAREWLKSMVNPQRALIGVWDMSEFQKNINNGFFG
jgi:hypothetical protein